MKIQKVITLMGDRLRLSFFVKENHTYSEDSIFMWFKNDKGEVILGDNYQYYADDFNKEEIKQELKEALPGEKKLYKELRMLMDEMTSYREIPDC